VTKLNHERYEMNNVTPYDMSQLVTRRGSPMRCVAQCGRKAKPGFRYCQQCLERALERQQDRGRYRPPKTFFRRIDRGKQKP
jgi:hypothetical protein